MLLWLLACALPAEVYPSLVPRVEVGQAAVAFPPAGFDRGAQADVLLTNRGFVSETLSLTVDDPRFSLTSAQLDLGPDTERSVTLQFLPTDVDPAQAVLTVVGASTSLRVDLMATTDPDADQDGVDHEALGGDDCDDLDPSIHPGATEIWYDGVDQDCDGRNDFDADQDGIEPPADCDDLDPEAFPGNPEVWYDGRDGDCSGGSDYDFDRDGYDSDLYGGADCDDTRKSVHPGAFDAWYDGLDSDCSGGSDFDQDADGHDAQSFGGDDCDDLDETVWSGC